MFTPELPVALKSKDELATAILKDNDIFMGQANVIYEVTKD